MSKDIINQFEFIIVLVIEIIKILKEEIGLRYKMLKVVPKQGNSDRSLYLRQRFAMKLLDLLKGGKRILNVDETHINESNYS